MQAACRRSGAVLKAAYAPTRLPPALYPEMGDSMVEADAIIVGSGTAGLACAATMRKLGLRVAILEKPAAVAAV